MLEELIEELPIPQKIVILGFYFENKNMREMAKECECSVRVIRKELRLAKKTLRKEVNPYRMGKRHYVDLVTPSIMFQVLKAQFTSENSYMDRTTAQDMYERLCRELGLQGTREGR